jgi:hypothetical protein
LVKLGKQAPRVTPVILGRKVRMDRQVYKDWLVLLGPWAIPVPMGLLAELAQQDRAALLAKQVEPVTQDVPAGPAELDVPAPLAQQETQETRAPLVPLAEPEPPVLEATLATRATQASPAHPAHLVVVARPEQLVQPATQAKPVELDPPEKEDKLATLATPAIRAQLAQPDEPVEQVFSVIRATRVQPVPMDPLVPMVVADHAVFSAPPAQIPTPKSAPLDKDNLVMRPSFMAPVAPMSITPCSAEATPHMPTIIISSCPRHPPTE